MKNISVPLSVVIVTKNRASDLRMCLVSLSLQTENPSELIIVDNNSTDNTKGVVKSFARTSSYPVRMVMEKKHGYPTIYNRGLKETKYKWVAFVDDDCIANNMWIASIRSSIQKYPHAAAILGLSETLCPHNPLSFAMFILNFIWKENGSIDKKIVSGEILDNKNIVYNKTFLRKHALSFNEHRAVYFNGASEDCALGDRIVRAGGNCFYCKNIIIAHKDPISHIHFIRKFFRSYRVYTHYISHTQKRTPKLQNSRKIRLLQILPQTMRQHHLTAIEMLLVLLVLTETLLLKNLFFSAMTIGRLLRIKTLK